MYPIKTIIGVLLLAAALQARAATVLCIGLNDYDVYPDLKLAESDATELGSALAGLGHTVQTITGTAVTRSNILQALARQPDIVYFAGHAKPGGVIVRDGTIALANLASARSMLVLDCCYIGLGLKTTGTMQILAASEYEAFESGTNGLFTKHLLQWLSDGNGLSSASLLTTYLAEKLRIETGGWQTPVLGFI